MAPTAGNRALLASLNRVNADMGLPAQEEIDPLKRGAGDISFVAADVDGLVGLGPASSGDHTPAETVDIASIWLPGEARCLADEPAKREEIALQVLRAGRGQSSAGTGVGGVGEAVDAKPDRPAERAIGQRP